MTKETFKNLYKRSEPIFFGKLLRKVRIQKRLSQKELAKKSFLTSFTIDDFETGIRKPSHQAFTRITNVLFKDN